MKLKTRSRIRGSFLLCVWMSAAVIGMRPMPAAAWGKEGHEIVARIAQNYLARHSPKALAKATELLGGQSLAEVATWADDIRNQRPETRNWHFVDIPMDKSDYDPARDCKPSPHGDCVVAALERSIAVLGDKAAGSESRAEALKFIVHFVGDIHQPLHAADDDDMGGNRKIVKFYALEGFHRGLPNLHEVWDSGLIEHSGKSEDELVKELTGEPTGPIDSDVAHWAVESHTLAMDAYKKLPAPDEQGVYPLDKDDTYYRAEIGVALNQLRQAGLRLGRVLERALG